MHDNETRAIDAAAAGIVFGMGNCLYRAIPVGGKFYFQHAPETVYRKLNKAGWYAVDGQTAPRFRTGMLTAVFSV